MITRLRFGVLTVIAATMLVMVGCASGDTEGQIIITYDGQGCSYDGPSVVSEGDQIIVLRNETGHDVVLDVCRLDPDKTWQDVLDNIDLWTGQPPTWVTFVRTRTLPENPEAREYALSEGLYALVCWSDSPLGAWPAAPLEVRGD